MILVWLQGQGLIKVTDGRARHSKVDLTEVAESVPEMQIMAELIYGGPLSSKEQRCCKCLYLCNVMISC